MLDKEKLAEAARNEVETHIREYPDKWIDEIVEDIADKDEFTRATITESIMGLRYTSPAREAIKSFAQKAGQAAYDSIIGHPGII